MQEHEHGAGAAEPERGKQAVRVLLKQYTPAHYRETGQKLVQDLLDQHIIKKCGDSRSEWCAPAHFVEKPGRVPLALRLVLDFTKLNDCLIRDQL